MHFRFTNEPHSSRIFKIVRGKNIIVKTEKNPVKTRQNIYKTLTNTVLHGLTI